MDKYFDNKLLKQGNEISTNEYLNNKKNIGIYFSKLNCEPCVEFTEKLIKVYNDIKKDDENLFEVVFISFDIMEELFNINYEKMPFLALPYDNYIKNDILKKMFEANAIPKLIILNNRGDVKINDGHSLINNNINNIINIINVLK
jgi:nucleoredoxin